MNKFNLKKKLSFPNEKTINLGLQHDLTSLLCTHKTFLIFNNLYTNAISHYMRVGILGLCE